MNQGDVFMALRNFFISLVENQTLTHTAQQYGLKLGAKNIVAGTSIHDALKNIQNLNANGYSSTVEHLAPVATNEDEATEAKNEIIALIDAIHTQSMDANISLHPCHLGLEIDIDFCYDNLHEIVAYAESYNIFINMTITDPNHHQLTLDMLGELTKTFTNVGTDIHSRLLRAKDDMEHVKDARLRIIKEIFFEPGVIAYQDQLDSDINFIELIESRLAHGLFTTIATHDHYIIKHVKYFVEEYNIPKDTFEFQIDFGFCKDLQQELLREGYNVCVYVPYGENWYRYVVRHFAEHPQHLSNATKRIFNKRTNTVLAVAMGAFLLGRLTKRK